MEANTNQSVTMRARVLRVDCHDLLVCDLCSGQEVIVHTENAQEFCPGDHICIQYNGAMTMSIPPQISAVSIRCMTGC